MKFLFSLLLIGLTSANIFAQSKTGNYLAAVSFNSKCCGVPDAKPLFTEILKFKKAHKIKSIVYDKIGPLGREGEFMLGFDLNNFTKSQKALFVTMLKKAVPTLKTNHTPESSGYAEVRLKEKKLDVKNLGRITIVQNKI